MPTATIPNIAGSSATAAADLRRLVALSPTFQAAVGAANVDDAMAAVFLKSAVGDAPRPYAVITPGHSHDYQMIGDKLFPKGTIYLYLTMDTSAELYDDLVAAEFEADSFFGSVTDDIVDVVNTENDDGSPFGETLAISSGPTRVQFGSNPEETWESLGRFYTGCWTIQWGQS